MPGSSGLVHYRGFATSLTASTSPKAMWTRRAGLKASTPDKAGCPEVPDPVLQDAGIPLAICVLDQYRRPGPSVAQRRLRLVPVAHRLGDRTNLRHACLLLSEAAIAVRMYVK
ncbi:hypothetical protein GCM10010199_00860 [Dactylosporangium roseum]